MIFLAGLRKLQLANLLETKCSPQIWKQVAERVWEHDLEVYEIIGGL